MILTQFDSSPSHIRSIFLIWCGPLCNRPVCREHLLNYTAVGHKGIAPTDNICWSLMLFHTTHASGLESPGFCNFHYIVQIAHCYEFTFLTWMLSPGPGRAWWCWAPSPPWSAPGGSHSLSLGPGASSLILRGCFFPTDVSVLSPCHGILSLWILSLCIVSLYCIQ